MPIQHHMLLHNPIVRAALQQAWQESHPGIAGGHEEGGFILQDAAGRLIVVRWSKGEQDAITLPPHPSCKIDENNIVATFHTHPNTGGDYLQEPGETDKRAVRDDPDLKGKLYLGEFVISQDTIYLIAPTGQVSEVADTQEIFARG